MVEVGGLLSTSPPSTNLLKKRMGGLLTLRKETENHLSWLQGVKAVRLSAERSRKRGGEKRKNEGKLESKEGGKCERKRCNV